MPDRGSKERSMEHDANTIRCTICGPCKVCGQTVMGWIVLNVYSQIVDSDGLLVFSDGIVCVPCLGGEAERKAIMERLRSRDKKYPAMNVY